MERAGGHAPQRMTDTHRTLHAWVKNLCRREVIRIITPHDLRTTNDPLQIVLPSHVHHQRPVLARVLVNLLGRTQELHFAHVHTL